MLVITVLLSCDWVVFNGCDWCILIYYFQNCQLQHGMVVVDLLNLGCTYNVCMHEACLDDSVEFY